MCWVSGKTREPCGLCGKRWFKRPEKDFRGDLIWQENQYSFPQPGFFLHSGEDFASVNEKPSLRRLGSRPVHSCAEAHGDHTSPSKKKKKKKPARPLSILTDNKTLLPPWLSDPLFLRVLFVQKTDDGGARGRVSDAPIVVSSAEVRRFASRGEGNTSRREEVGDNLLGDALGTYVTRRTACHKVWHNCKEKLTKQG